MHPKFMDDGLTKAYALYWASATRLQVPVFGHFHSIFFTSRSTRLAFLHDEIDESNSIQNFKSFQIYSILLTLHDTCMMLVKILGEALRFSHLETAIGHVASHFFVDLTCVQQAR